MGGGGVFQLQNVTVMTDDLLRTPRIPKDIPTVILGASRIYGTALAMC